MATQTVYHEPSPQISEGATHSHSVARAGWTAIRVDSDPIAVDPATSTPAALLGADNRCAQEHDSETEVKAAALDVAGVAPADRTGESSVRQRSSKRARNSQASDVSTPQTAPAADLPAQNNVNMLLSVAALLQEGRPASDPPLVDATAIEDASWLPSTSVLYDCGGTDAAAPPVRAEGVDAVGRNGLKPDRSQIATGTPMAFGAAPVPSSLPFSSQPQMPFFSQPPMPGMPPGSMAMMPCGPARQLCVSTNPAVRTAAQFLRDAAPHSTVSASDSACFHCPHCSAAINAADIAHSAAQQQMLRLHGAQGAPHLMPPLQPELVVGHPVASNPLLPVYPYATHGAAAAINANASGASAQTDVFQPVMPDTTFPASSAPDAAKEGKKLSKPRPRHIIHVGSELKDAVTRLTAMLPTNGPVAEIVQPLLDNTYKSYDSVYSARVTNEDFARAMNEAIRRLAKTQEGRDRLAKVVQALRAHPELQKPKRPARTVYAGADPNKCAATAPPAPTKFRNKRPDKNTGSTPVLGRDSEEPQLAFRREYGSRGAFMELALLVLDGTGGSGSPSDSTACRVTATVQEKNLILWAGIVCLLDAALLQCTLAGDETARREVLKYFSECVLPSRLHYIVTFLPHHAPATIRC